jgi:ABC-type glutathione transport system ATPase component
LTEANQQLAVAKSTATLDHDQSQAKPPASRSWREPVNIDTTTATPGGLDHPAANGRGDPVLEVDRVTKIYPSEPPVTALRNISFAVERAELMGIVGPSGSAKPPCCT